VKKCANKFHLVQHACKILFVARVANKNKQGLGVGIAGFVVYLVSASVPIVFAESLHLFLVNGVSFTIHNQNSITFAGTKFDLAVINHSYALRLKLFTFLPRGMLPIHTHTAYSTTLKVKHLSMFTDQRELAWRDISDPRYHMTLTGQTKENCNYHTATI